MLFIIIGVANSPSPPSTEILVPTPEQTAAQQPVAPQPVAPQPVAPQPVAPQPVAPEQAAQAAQAADPQPVAPQPVAPQPVAPQPSNDSSSSAVYYKNCDAARAAGAAPINRGEPGYRSALDRDNDGVACE
ncbi:MAG: excalibur calcium-binding domain-containing protein [Pseudonocardiaceae bacterium]